MRKFTVKSASDYVQVEADESNTEAGKALMFYRTVNGASRIVALFIDWEYWVENFDEESGPIVA